jgi:Raf kinase inhibitor-like YbhB/YbcL family protein
MRRPPISLLCLGAVVVAGCGAGSGESVKGPPPDAPTTIVMRSPAFKAGAMIPKQFTCDGGDRPPPLRFEGAPKEAKELALLVEDPDTRGGTFVHWAVWGIPPATRALGGDALPAAATQGENSFGNTRYNGPCPPKSDDPHRYQFVVYALSRPLGLDKGAGAKKVRAAIAKVAIAKGETYGTYGR